MSDDDLIRRGDALNAIKPIYGWSITAAEGVWGAIAALPAQGAVVAPVDALVKAAGDVLQQLDDLIANSEGVAGLHQNGDVAKWESLLDGGSFGEWLYKLEELRAALTTENPNG